MVVEASMGDVKEEDEEDASEGSFGCCSDDASLERIIYCYFVLSIIQV